MPIDPEGITCPRCGATSHHPDDIRFHYCGACHQFHDDVDIIAFWVIYDHPRDYPNDYVLRKQVTVFVPGCGPFEMQDQTCEVGTLKELRALVPRTAVNLGRNKNDDPVILEVWMQ